jgi:hypothetical protein
MGCVQRLQPGVVMDLGLLAVQAGLGPGGDIVGEAVPDKSRRNKYAGRRVPGWKILCKLKNVCSKLDWFNWAENAS